MAGMHLQNRFVIINQQDGLPFDRLDGDSLLDLPSHSSLSRQIDNHCRSAIRIAYVDTPTMCAGSGQYGR